MNNIKLISKKRKVKRQDKDNLNQLIKQNPNLLTLIDKLDLLISKTQSHEHK